MPQHDDDIYLGQAVPGGQLMGTPSATQMLRGIGPTGRVYAIDLGSPSAASTTAVCAAQAIGGAGNATINGTASLVDYVRGQRVASFTNNNKVGICLQMASSNAGDNTQTVTVTGRDIYGQRMTQVKTLNGTTAVNFTKAFKFVDIVAVSAALGGNLTVGTRDAFGFPICVLEGGYIIKIGWGNVYGPDPGTVVTADTTDPATSSTNDVRGFYTPSSAANGSTRLTVTIMLTDAMVGPNATRKGAFGVTQA